MKKIVTVISCDWCYHVKQEEVDATTTPLLTLGPRVRTLDLCEVHLQALEKARALVDTKGTKPASPSNSGKGGDHGRAR